MTRNLLMRRIVVIAGVVAALVVGATSIRAAGVWTAASAPLIVAPASLTSINASLDTERQRSADLQFQLESISGAVSDLEAALVAAQDQITTDATTAGALRADLAAAKTRLLTLEAALRRAAAQRVTTGPTNGATGTTSTPAPTAEPQGDD